MLRATLFSLVLTIGGCGGSTSPEPGPGQPPRPTSAVQAPALHLRVQGRMFVRADASPFEWRGISAFALVEQVANGRASEAENYLAWAASQRITVVRVLVMAQHLFKLSPDQGRAALPRTSR